MTDPLADPQDDDSDGEPGRVDRLRAWLRPDDEALAERGETLRDAAATAREYTVRASRVAAQRSREAWAWTKPRVTSLRAKTVYLIAALVLAGVAAVYYTLQSRGPLATVLYTFLFVMSALLFPIAINLFGSIMPNSVGRLHLLLGAVAFDHHYLVQRQHGWEWCPGDRGRVWIDGAWHEVSGEDNYSVLGWRPFGILRYKDDATWAAQRADQAGQQAQPTFETDPTADGGTERVERGGFEEVPQPAVSGLDGTWLLDLKRVFTDGIRKIGDIELIETAEEVIERGEVNEESMGGYGPTVRVLGGLLLGVIATYGYVFMMG